MERKHKVKVTLGPGLGFTADINSDFDISRDWEKVKTAGKYAGKAVNLINETKSADLLIDGMTFGLKLFGGTALAFTLIAGIVLYFFHDSFEGLFGALVIICGIRILLMIALIAVGVIILASYAKAKDKSDKKQVRKARAKVK